jgi:hypothetical protein
LVLFQSKLPFRLTDFSISHNRLLLRDNIWSDRHSDGFEAKIKEINCKLAVPPYQDSENFFDLSNEAFDDINVDIVFSSARYIQINSSIPDIEIKMANNIDAEAIHKSIYSRYDEKSRTVYQKKISYDSNVIPIRIIKGYLGTCLGNHKQYWSKRFHCRRWFRRSV